MCHALAKDDDFEFVVEWLTHSFLNVTDFVVLEEMKGI